MRKIAALLLICLFSQSASAKDDDPVKAWKWKEYGYWISLFRIWVEKLPEDDYFYVYPYLSFVSDLNTPRTHPPFSDKNKDTWMSLLPMEERSLSEAAPSSPWWTNTDPSEEKELLGGPYHEVVESGKLWSVKQIPLQWVYIPKSIIDRGALNANENWDNRLISLRFWADLHSDELYGPDEDTKLFAPFVAPDPLLFRFEALEFEKQKDGSETAASHLYSYKVSFADSAIMKNAEINVKFYFLIKRVPVEETSKSPDDLITLDQLLIDDGDRERADKKWRPQVDLRSWLWADPRSEERKDVEFLRFRLSSEIYEDSVKARAYNGQLAERGKALIEAAEGTTHFPKLKAEFNKAVARASREHLMGTKSKYLPAIPYPERFIIGSADEDEKLRAALKITHQEDLEYSKLTTAQQAGRTVGGAAKSAYQFVSGLFE